MGFEFRSPGGFASSGGLEPVAERGNTGTRVWLCHVGFPLLLPEASGEGQEGTMLPSIVPVSYHMISTL